MIPTVGRTVLYKLNEVDADVINRRRTTSDSIRQRMTSLDARKDGYGWPEGAQAHVGNSVMAGQVYPMVICRTWGSTEESAVNGQVFLDGNDTYWATSRVCGDNPGNWQWPSNPEVTVATQEKSPT